MSESTAHTTEASGWGRGLAAWVLASYTDPGDLVLDLDGDTGVQTAAATMRRNYLDVGDQAPRTDGWGLRGQAALVTSRWPRRPAAAYDAGLGHLQAVHAVAAHPPFGSPGWQERSVVGYRCALVLRKAGRHAHP